MAEIELKPGTPFCTADDLNRVARQQGLCLAIAQAFIFDEICQIIQLPDETEADLINRFRLSESLEGVEDLQHFLQTKNWTERDLLYFATKNERLDRFRWQLFENDVELRFLECKTELDEISYSLIRLRNADLAFELHQRLIEEEATFEALATLYSEGPEKETEGKLGPVPLSQAHPVLVEKLRISQPGQLWEPFFLKDIWVILRLDSWVGARLDESTKQQMVEELFEEWLHDRALQILHGQTPHPLPQHKLTSQLME